MKDNEHPMSKPAHKPSMPKAKPLAAEREAIAAAEDWLIEARSLRQDAQNRLDAAVVTVQTAEAAVHVAWMAHDAQLPQCTMLVRSGHTSKPLDRLSMVILRQTPGGEVLLREAGKPSSRELRFAWNKFSSSFQEKIPAGRGYRGMSTRELVDVPPQFLPAGHCPEPAEATEALQLANAD